MSSTPTSPTKLKTAARVRQEFLDFFAARGHRIVPSGPVFPQDDPTLLFTNAGMNQFKDVFLGTGTRDYTRAADTQKCIRVSGKHNDLEEVGVDTYHHTFFEMLGNWSFGDYFKAEAIAWSWELLTKTWGLDPDRLWVTVFAGDAADGLPADDESARIWVEVAGVRPDRVLKFGRKANFWEMGDTGPCGPCTEIHIDRGAPGSDPRDGANPAIGVNAGNERFMELWNNVFIQFNRLEDGRLQELPAKHVDTGMGFERVLSVLQGQRSNYDTDLFTPIFARIAAVTGARYEGGDAPRDVAFRVAADHCRAVTAAFADGALPSNEGRGYVLRRLIRRASRFGRQHLGARDPFLFEVVPAVVQVLGATFPEMRAREEHVRLLMKSEEESFGRTLDRGLVFFESLAAKTEKAGSKTLAGAEAFELYATNGFPEDLVELMARERGLAVDRAGWEAAQKRHQAASKSEGKFKQVLSAEALASVKPTRSTYHEAGAEAQVLEARVLVVQAVGEGEHAVVLDASPFYAEGGGQVGDAGVIRAADGSFTFEVRDARRTGAVVVHLGTFQGGRVPAPEALSGARVRAEVDAARRERVRKHHTATHLLHRALKEVLGAHVAQQGSYVGPDRLRFDISHPRAVTPEELERVEALVNARVCQNDLVRTTIEDLEQAKARGVVAMFGEKYDAQVRVLDVGGWSLELCGGTHVRAAGEIGPFVILSERAVQAGVRRLEAVTGPAAVEEIQRQRRILRDAAQALKSAVDELPARVELLQAQLKEAKKQGAKQQGGDVAAAFERSKALLERTGGAAFGVFDLPELGLEGVRELAERLKGAESAIAFAVLGREEGRVPFVIVCQNVPKSSGLKAGDLAKLASASLGGGGGGRPDAAQGQGQREAGVPAALSALRAAIAEGLARA
ncbi:MAG: alanine--tRNA ligase [Planctomycetes bacterium]|nr:alanine--tRNA ligase [Planctomycetota bacterium]